MDVLPPFSGIPAISKQPRTKESNNGFKCNVASESVAVFILFLQL
jgi:hypothetical protein